MKNKQNKTKNNTTKNYRIASITKSYDESAHTAWVVVSSDCVDRYGDTIPTNIWNDDSLKNYLAHPIVMSNHDKDSSLKKVIGQCNELKIEGTEVLANIEWFVDVGNDESDWGWFLITKNLGAFSIGFIEKEFSKNSSGGQDYQRIELFDISQVLVPANPEAIQKSLNDIEKTKYKKFINTETKQMDENGNEITEETPEENPESNGDEKYQEIITKLDELGTAINTAIEKIEALKPNKDEPSSDSVENEETKTEGTTESLYGYSNEDKKDIETLKKWLDIK